jgi:hypothetical protein
VGAAGLHDGGQFEEVEIAGKDTPWLQIWRSEQIGHFGFLALVASASKDDFFVRKSAMKFAGQLHQLRGTYKFRRSRKALLTRERSDAPKTPRQKS